MVKNRLTSNSIVLPCPFCGGVDLIFEEAKSTDGTVTFHYLHHSVTNECSIIFMHDNKDKLIELWNNRVASTTE